jgi:hypothetical protein
LVYFIQKKENDVSEGVLCCGRRRRKGGRGGGIEDAYPMMLPTDWPMKTIPLVRERLVWPAVFCAARLYIIGLIAG